LIVASHALKFVQRCSAVLLSFIADMAVFGYVELLDGRETGG
jgi:hypothetical protein